MLSGSLMFMRRALIAPSSSRTQLVRSVVHWIPAGLDPKELRDDMNEFAERVDLSGQDEYPYFRKEHRKRKEWRFDVHNKWKGRISQHKVRGLVDFIEYKRSHKYQ